MILDAKKPIFSIICAEVLKYRKKKLLPVGARECTDGDRYTHGF